eukprot:CAMPEP_0119553586 /NCGR_PEP_ID=MMETSP1352-20130426/6307_1 /TAXON_ID=265584 /ORGANISM="Stauroneis constricta, Strain CCMP1120" /LENGTH=115 /DNA_ID=CAMNT_0007600025 /DNA_START=52 /DNA_END=396 /DNA_ORIENTATION=+
MTNGGSLRAVQRITIQPKSISNGAANSTEIIFWSSVHVVLVAILFTWPRFVARRWTGEGFALTAYVMGFYCLFGCGTIALSLGVLLMTISKWSSITTWSKIAGMFPFVSNIAIGV